MKKLSREINTVIWRHLMSRFLYCPTRIDYRGQGNAVFSPWRTSHGEFLGYVGREPPQAKNVFVFFHGKDGEALEEGWITPILSSEQIVVLAEYPGYGARLGCPSEGAILDAALQVIESVKNRWDLPIRISGESLGSSVACYAASHYEVAKVALISPFSSLSDIIAHRFPILPIPEFLASSFMTKEYIDSMKAPLHIVHGEADRIVPIVSSEALFATYQGSAKHFTKFHNADHLTLRQAVLTSKQAASFRNFISS